MGKCGVPPSTSADFLDASTAYNFFSIESAVGICDASIAVSYLLNVDLLNWYIATLGFKFCLLLITSNRRLVKNIASSLVFGAATFLVLISVFTGELDAEFNLPAYVRAGEFLAHLLLSIRLVDPRHLRTYCQAASSLLFALAAFHAVLCYLGKIDDTYGRYSYFGGSHPNLGGEINAIAAVIAFIGWGKRTAYVMVGFLS